MSRASNGHQLHESLISQAVSSLADSTGVQASIKNVEPSKHLDGVVVIRNGKKRWNFSIEVKRQLTSHTLGSAIAAVSEVRRKHGPSALVASYVNPSQAEKLRELGIEFFDTAGNAFLKQEGLHVFVTGRKARDVNAPEVQRARAFNATGSRLVFALLCHPGLENKSYRAIAKEAGISLGAVSWIVNDLKSLGYLSDLGPRGRRISNRKELLKRWVSAYPEQLRPKLILGRYRTERARDWWQKAELPSEAFWSGEVAAQLVTRYLRPETVTIYAESNLPRLQAQYGLRRDSKGDIELLRKFWKFDQWEDKHLHSVPPLLIYADLLMTADDRNLETAEIIYERYIARLVE